MRRTHLKVTLDVALDLEGNFDIVDQVKRSRFVLEEGPLGEGVKIVKVTVEDVRTRSEVTGERNPRYDARGKESRETNVGPG